MLWSPFNHSCSTSPTHNRVKYSGLWGEVSCHLLWSPFNHSCSTSPIFNRVKYSGLLDEASGPLLWSPFNHCCCLHTIELNILDCWMRCLVGSGLHSTTVALPHLYTIGLNILGLLGEVSCPLLWSPFNHSCSTSPTYNRVKYSGLLGKAYYGPLLWPHSTTVAPSHLHTIGLNTLECLVWSLLTGPYGPV
jgi:hypothetical protein